MPSRPMKKKKASSVVRVFMAPKGSNVVVYREGRRKWSAINQRGPMCSGRGASRAQAVTALDAAVKQRIGQLETSLRRLKGEP